MCVRVYIYVCSACVWTLKFQTKSILWFWLNVPWAFMCFKVKAIAIHPELFTVENGLLTPTLKAKRNEMRQFFRPQLDQMYAGIKM